MTLVEMLDQVLGPLDRGDGAPRRGPSGAGMASTWRSMTAWPDSSRLDGGAIEVATKSGKAYPADIVILALGVRPDTTLAKTAGLEIGERGGIRVDEQMRTSDPDIFAVGDAVEVKDFVTGEWSLVALAGPANRQGRIAADVIAGRDSRYRGTQGTSIIGLFGAAAAWTGASEKTLKRLGDKDFEKIYLYPELARRLLPGRQADRDEGHLPQVRRTRCSARRRSARTAWTSGSARWPWPSRWARRSTTSKKPSSATRRSSAAPRTRSTSRGWWRPMSCAATCRSAHWDAARRRFLLDVREPVELAVERVPGAVNIPLGQLRARLGELPRDREIHRHLPLRPARLLRDAHPAAERVQGPDHLRRHAVAGARDDLLGAFKHGVSDCVEM